MEGAFEFLNNLFTVFGEWEWPSSIFSLYVMIPYGPYHCSGPKGRSRELLVHWKGHDENEWKNYFATIT